MKLCITSGGAKYSFEKNFFTPCEICQKTTNRGHRGPVPFLDFKRITNAQGSTKIPFNVTDNIK